MATFSHRLYKDEFSKEFIYQLEHGQIDGLMATDESSEKVLVIVGELEILEKLGHIMYCEDEQKIKSVFPSFITKEDQERAEKQTFNKTYNELRDNLCKMIGMAHKTHHKSTKEFDMMYDLYCQMMELARA